MVLPHHHISLGHSMNNLMQTLSSPMSSTCSHWAHVSDIIIVLLVLRDDVITSRWVELTHCHWTTSSSVFRIHPDTSEWQESCHVWWYGGRLSASQWSLDCRTTGTFCGKCLHIIIIVKFLTFILVEYSPLIPSLTLVWCHHLFTERIVQCNDS